MNLFNKIISRVAAISSSGLDEKGKSDLIRAFIFNITKNNTILTRNNIKLDIFSKDFRQFPMQNFEDRIRTYGWFDLLSRIDKIDGDIVEAGVGYGQTFINLVCASAFFSSDKVIYGFDSFEGFPLPHQNDLGKRVRDLNQLSGWIDTSPEVIINYIQKLSDKDYFPDPGNIKLIKGFFNETIPENLPEKISLLHIDNDLYEGAKHILFSCFDRLEPGAVVIIDEFTDEKWPGVKKAADEFNTVYNQQFIFFKEILRWGFIKK